MKLTLTNEDGSTQDFFPQAYTDDAVKAALASATTAVTEVEVVEGSATEKFVPEA